MPARELLVAVGNPLALQGGGELAVLSSQRIPAARVEPVGRVRRPQRRSDRRQRVEGRVRVHLGERAAEDRVVVRRALVPRPALDDVELAGVVEGDVDRALPA